MHVAEQEEAQPLRAGIAFAAKGSRQGRSPLAASALGGFVFPSTTSGSVITALSKLHRAISQVVEQRDAPISCITIEVVQVAEIRREVALAWNLALGACADRASAATAMVHKTEQVGEGSWHYEWTRRSASFGASSAHRRNKLVEARELLAIVVQGNARLNFFLYGLTRIRKYQGFATCRVRLGGGRAWTSQRG